MEPPPSLTIRKAILLCVILSSISLVILFGVYVGWDLAKAKLSIWKPYQSQQMMNP